MKIISICAASALAVLGLGAAANADVVLDQVLDQSLNASFNMDASSLEWQQEITVGVAGQLMQIDVSVSTLGNATFYVNAGPPWQSDPNDFEILFIGDTTGWHSVDVSSAGLNFDVGDKFVFGWIGLNQGLWTRGAYEAGGDPYPAGALWLNGSHHTSGDNWNLGFRTWVDEAGTTCPADLNGDGFVNVTDLLMLLGAWGTDGPGADLAEPLDIVNVSDLLVLLGAWGPC